jgi:hypothetical protein
LPSVTTLPARAGIGAVSQGGGDAPRSAQKNRVEPADAADSKPVFAQTTLSWELLKHTNGWINLLRSLPPSFHLQMAIFTISYYIQNLLTPESESVYFIDGVFMR